MSLDDLKRKFPITTISSIPSKEYKIIKIGKEKIWIPWRIIDYNNNNFVNHTDLLFPIIYYYSRIKDKFTNDFNLTTKKLNYKLCNETTLAIENITYQIDVPLNEIYCIDMDDLDIGGSWTSENIHYIEFDLYFCENGINYEENNPKCSSFNKIMNFIGQNNSLDLAIYYPIIQFQPTNKTDPIIVFYRQYFYHLSKYANKIERIYLQENVLTDDSGWILKKELNKSYWGLNTKEGDSYSLGNDKDLMNEGSNSRAYSFNLYLEPGIIHYKRYYKKIYTIFSDFFSVAYIFFIIMKNISKLFKEVENNKKIIELLFENLKEKQKPNIIEGNLPNLQLQSNSDKNRKLSFIPLINKKNDYNLKKHKFSMVLQYLRNKNNVGNSTLSLNKDFLNNNENNINNSFSNEQKKANTSNLNLIKNDNYVLNSKIIKSKKEQKNIVSMKPKEKLIKGRIFPYSYYLCSVFIKNLNSTKGNYFFSSKFAKIYTFLCHLFDLTTYLSLQREFNNFKKLFSDNNIKETKNRININSIK